MTTNLKDKLGMYLKVQDNLRDHSGDYASHPKMATVTKTFTDKLTAIYDAASRFELDNTGATEDKAIRRNKLLEHLYKLGKALRSFSEEAPLKTLKNRVGFTLAELQSLRDADLHLKAIQVKQFAQPHLEALKEFRIQASDMELLEQLRDDFLLHIPNPKQENEIRTVAGKELDQLFSETDLVLQKIDDYLDSYRFEQPFLWEEYRLARSIDQTGSRKSKNVVEGTIAPGQVKEAVNIDYAKDRRFIVRNTGKAALTVSLNNINTAMAVYTVGIMPGNTMDMLSYELNISPDARYLMLQNKDSFQEARYEVSMEMLGTP